MTESVAKTAGKKVDLKSTASNLWNATRGIFTKPITTLNERLSEYANIKNAGILAVVVSIVAVLVALISSMISAVHTKSCSLWTGQCTTRWDFAGLGNINYFQTIFATLLIYIATIAAVAGIFFGISRIFKQTKTNYCRMAAVTAFAILPNLAAILIASLIGIIDPTMQIVISMAGGIYALFVFYEGINAEVALTDDKKVYYNFASALAFIVVCYILVRIFFGSILTNLVGIF